MLKEFTLAQSLPEGLIEATAHRSREAAFPAQEICRAVFLEHGLGVKSLRRWKQQRKYKRRVEKSCRTHTHTSIRKRIIEHEERLGMPLQYCPHWTNSTVYCIWYNIYCSIEYGSTCININISN